VPPQPLATGRRVSVTPRARHHVGAGRGNVAAEFSGLPRLDSETRRELVAVLSGEGMSLRAIAPIVGVSHGSLTAGALGCLQSC
jgi:hypothetical protein